MDDSHLAPEQTQIIPLHEARHCAAVPENGLKMTMVRLRHSSPDEVTMSEQSFTVEWCVHVPSPVRKGEAISCPRRPLALRLSPLMGRCSWAARGQPVAEHQRVTFHLEFAPRFLFQELRRIGDVHVVEDNPDDFPIVSIRFLHFEGSEVALRVDTRTTNSAEEGRAGPRLVPSWLRVDRLAR